MIFDINLGAEIRREAIDNDNCSTPSEGNIGGLCTQQHATARNSTWISRISGRKRTMANRRNCAAVVTLPTMNIDYVSMYTYLRYLYNVSGLALGLCIQARATCQPEGWPALLSRVSER